MAANGDRTAGLLEAQTLMIACSGHAAVCPYLIFTCEVHVQAASLLLLKLSKDIVRAVTVFLRRCVDITRSPSSQLNLIIIAATIECIIKSFIQGSVEVGIKASIRH